MNFKRGRPKNARAGCRLCKPYKANGAKRKGRMRAEQKWMRRVELEDASSS